MVRGIIILLLQTMFQNRIAEGFFVLLLATVIVAPLQWATRQIKLEKPATGIPVAEDTLLPEVSAETLSSGPLQADVWAGLADSLRKQKHPLARFFTKLQACRDGKSRARVAYFGDSMIEGDLITETLRAALQQEFGGTGVGFMALTSQAYAFRKTVFHRFEGGWQNYSLQGGYPKEMALGISGEAFFAGKESGSWVRYKDPAGSPYERVSLYYGRSADSLASQAPTISFSGKTMALDGTSEVNEARISRTPLSDIRINFENCAELPLYGVSLESEYGALVDNFAFRGSSGQNLIKIPSQVLRQFDRHLEYNLVILHFGLNVVSADRENFDNYTKGMAQVVAHFRRAMPNADILVISVSDRCTRIGGSWQTDPSVPKVVESQRQAAELSGAAFLNLFEEMGGNNTLVRWVKAKPALARSDYAHPTREGAARIGEIVHQYLFREMSNWEGKTAAN
ncbi:MAG: hypothetical protein EAZ89_16465 [Bacteroidetes bacterium]|nr:MAG: hypothetical protein EAZ89_16465 [Bacteroidota bacterium]